MTKNIAYIIKFIIFMCFTSTENTAITYCIEIFDWFLLFFHFLKIFLSVFYSLDIFSNISLNICSFDSSVLITISAFIYFYNSMFFLLFLYFSFYNSVIFLSIISLLFLFLNILLAHLFYLFFIFLQH